MAISVTLQLVAFALVFTMFGTHGEQDCYREKDLVKERCMETIKIGAPYVPTIESCHHTMGQSDMTCIFHILTIEELLIVSAAKIVLLAKDCHKPVPAGTKCGSKYIEYVFFK
jgi:hypothetical protein